MVVRSSKIYRSLQDVSISPEVAQFFSLALEQHKLAQSYVFVAAPSTDASHFVQALAKALLCDEGGCDECEICYKISANLHPDVHVLKPASTTGYLIEQAREVVREAAQTAVLGNHKLFVFEASEQLFGAPANALLKTIEEPPKKTHFIFITSSIDRMLPTIVSRSQVIPFKAPSRTFLKEYIRAKSEASEMQIEIALATFSRPEDALYFLDSEEGTLLRQARQQLFKTLFTLSRQSDYETMSSGKELAEFCESKKKRGRESLLEYDKSFYSPKQLKEAEVSKKREEKTRILRNAELIFACAQVFFEDLLKLQVHHENIANQDIKKELQSYALTLRNSQVLKALNILAKGVEDIRTKVSIQLSFEAVLLSLKEVICQK